LLVQIEVVNKKWGNKDCLGDGIADKDEKNPNTPKSAYFLEWEQDVECGNTHALSDIDALLVVPEKRQVKY
jgi:hypothetical protein